MYYGIDQLPMIRYNFASNRIKSMKTGKYIIAIVIAALAFVQFSSLVQADDVEHYQEQDFEVVCDMGAYGQNVNCRASGSQEQYQRTHFERDKAVAYRYGKPIRVHKVVDTGLDTTTFAIAWSTVLLGGVATAVKLFA